MFIPDPNFSIPDPGSKRYGSRWPQPPHPPLPAILEPSQTNIKLSFVSSVADPGCLSWIRIFPTRIQGQKDMIPGGHHLLILLCQQF